MNVGDCFRGRDEGFILMIVRHMESTNTYLAASVYKIVSDNSYDSSMSTFSEAYISRFCVPAEQEDFLQEFKAAIAYQIDCVEEAMR